MRYPAVLALLLLAGCMQAVDEPPPGVATPSTVTYDAIRFDTDLGPITVILYNQSAPQTVALMLAYANEGYYVGRSFSRIVPGHVIQVTDPAGGATDDARRVPVEVHAAYHFSAGAAGIARSEDVNSGGPQFFLMDFATSHLRGNYTVWGQVVEGLDTVHRIARGPAFDFRSLPPETSPLAPTDSLALQPTTIRATMVERVTFPAGAFPLEVAQNRRAGDLRHSLEWPGAAAPGTERPFTWYIRPYNGTAAPPAADVRILAGGMEIRPTGEPETPGVYHFRWAPGPGRQEVSLAHAGRTMATLAVES